MHPPIPISDVTLRARCLGCAEPALDQVLDLGVLPMAGDHHLGPRARVAPLHLDGCSRCGLVQVRENVPHHELFNAQYTYASSTVPSLVDHFTRHAAYLAALSDGPILEVGCNDGVLLDPLRALGRQAVGVDASANVADAARARGLDVRTGRFGAETLDALLRPDEIGTFGVVTCSNVFAHNEDVASFLAAVRRALRPGGLLVIEVHDSDAVASGGQWDFVYHEHALYWTEESLVNVLARHGFAHRRTDRTPMHGGALRCVFAAGAAPHALAGVGGLSEAWRSLQARSARSAGILHDVVAGLAGAGVSLFGAAGRATTLVAYAGLAPHLRDAFDGSPLRAGGSVPGSDVRVRPEQEVADAAPYVLLGAWHLEAALRAKLPPDRRVVVPLPNVRVA